ncbi:efflux RND transporter periplasmic adaptor subunit [Caldimonas brevitalea]|uniref:Cytochrome C peroxidase n=1 Tax=Caldimonas brevitalea TaxID=413882 RepID=A0A0G3BR44_9BURK|nr:efflux RND transporter periplasmic adaptor subunit [Caldimonas brevitalea]AKJ31897.1 cytochrome C peroxidase [Caldimonas brevitalea]
MKLPAFSLSKKHALIIALLLAFGVAGGVAILHTEPAQPAGGDGHGHEHDHEESEGHADAKHHGGAGGDGHDHAEGHTDAEPRQDGVPAKGPHGGEHRSKGEAVIRLADAQIKAAGITLDTSSAARLQSSFQLPGEIRFNEDRTAHVVPRVRGVVESVAAHLGQQVKKGQLLAVISSPEVSEQRSELQAAQRRLTLAKTTYEREKKLWEEKISPEQDVLQAQHALREAEIAVANAHQKLQALGVSASASSLSRFELRAPFDGAVVEKHIALGEVVKEDANVFTISDLSTVWAALSVPAQQLNQVRVGEPVTIRSSAFDETAGGTVAYVGALIGEQTRTAQARVALANPKGAWRPGLFVTVELVASDAEVPVTVAKEALQTLEDRQVVFVKVPGGFLPQPVETGRSDAKRVEIVKGLKAGVPYAAAGSFVVKSEVGKATAEHVH